MCQILRAVRKKVKERGGNSSQSKSYDENQSLKEGFLAGVRKLPIMDKAFDGLGVVAHWHGLTLMIPQA